MEFTVHRFETIGSTNDAAIALARDGAMEGTVVVASQQISGRGRRKRSWESPPGCGLYLSLIVRPPKPADELWQMAFVASVAVVEAIREVSGLSAQVKWPNDILINGKKVCGILIESRVSAKAPLLDKEGVGGGPGIESTPYGPPCKGGQLQENLTPGPSPLRLRSLRQAQGMARQASPSTEKGVSIEYAVIIGIGINVNTSGFPSELVGKASSLMLEMGSFRVVELQVVEDSLLKALDARYSCYLDNGFEPLLDMWKSLDCTVGRTVSVHTQDGVVSGTAVDVDRGDLAVECLDGSIARITAGEVFLRDE